MIPVILSGGSGTRLWPLSRGVYPKQFLPLVSDKTMVQETVLRLEGIENLQAPIAVCNEDHRFMMAEQLREVGVQPEAIILEPIGKNTAPAVALAALAAKKPNDILLVLPADHVIENIPAFQQAVIKAERWQSKVIWLLLVLCQRLQKQVMAILSALRKILVMLLKLLNL